MTSILSIDVNSFPKTGATCNPDSSYWQYYMFSALSMLCLTCRSPFLSANLVEIIKTVQSATTWLVKSSVKSSLPAVCSGSAWPGHLPRVILHSTRRCMGTAVLYWNSESKSEVQRWQNSQASPFWQPSACRCCFQLLSLPFSHGNFVTIKYCRTFVLKYAHGRHWPSWCNVLSCQEPGIRPATKTDRNPMAMMEPWNESCCFCAWKRGCDLPGISVEHLGSQAHKSNQETHTVDLRYHTCGMDSNSKPLQAGSGSMLL